MYRYKSMVKNSGQLWAVDSDDCQVALCQTEEDARRVTAALNATAHVPLDILEGAEADETVRQRDALLAACRALIASHQALAEGRQRLTELIDTMGRDTEAPC
jgi:hypothetical protein